MIDSVPVEALLDAYPEPTRRGADLFRRLVRRALPEAVERVRLGWRIVGYDVPSGRRSVYFAWIMPQAEHVHLGFTYGVLMDDPEGLLEGDITRARWVTLWPGDAIANAAGVENLVREAARVAQLPRRSRLASLLDRELAGPGHG